MLTFTKTFPASLAPPLQCDCIGAPLFVALTPLAARRSKRGFLLAFITARSRLGDGTWRYYLSCDPSEITVPPSEAEITGVACQGVIGEVMLKTRHSHHREIWSPLEHVEHNGERYGGHIDVGGRLVHVRLSHGSFNAARRCTARLVVAGVGEFLFQIIQESQRFTFPPDIVVADGTRIDVVTTLEDELYQAGPLGLEMEVVIE